MDYQVTITMDPATVNGLNQSDSALCVYRAVTAADPAARPVVWARLEYSANTEIRWADKWAAYTSLSPIVGGQDVTAGFSVGINLGQTLKVSSNGLGTVFNGGTESAISIQNTTSTPYTCGACCAVNASPATPFCAFPLHGNNLQTITPLQTVLLQFTSQPTKPGTILAESAAAYAESAAAYVYSLGYLIDLTPAANNRQVCFDIDAGWSNGNAPWAQSVSANPSSLTSWLIQR